MSDWLLNLKVKYLSGSSQRVTFPSCLSHHTRGKTNL
jgi:hypothetical protein